MLSAAFFISTSDISAREFHLHRLSAICPIIGEPLQSVKQDERGDRHART